MAVEFFVHKMSEHMEKAMIGEWLVKEGDPVQSDTPVMVVETDKSVVELYAEASGVIKNIRQGAEAGNEVPVGETLAFIAKADENVPVLPPLGNSTEMPTAEVMIGQKETVAAQISDTAAISTEDVLVRATPVARRVAKELGVDIKMVKTTDPKGVIRRNDVEAFTAGKPAAENTEIVQNTAVSSSVEDYEWIELNTIQKLTGRRMLESVSNAPQFSISYDIEIQNLMDLRQKLNEIAQQESRPKVSVTAIFIKAIAAALKLHPKANAVFDDESTRIKAFRNININVAVGTENGLVVPVIRNVDQKSVFQINKEIKDFQVKADNLRFSPEDFEGGTFTVSNLGMYGVSRFTAIINPPQSAILAIGGMEHKAVQIPDGNVGFRPVVSFTLSIDHRVMDGKTGALFLADVKKYLEQPLLLL